MSNAFDDVCAALDLAKHQLEAADTVATNMAVLLMGRLRTIQYNGDELADNDLYGMLSGLASEGDIHVKLLAPAELVSAKKGYRAGKADTPPRADDDGQQQQLPDGGDDEQDLDPDSPEGRLVAST